MRERGVKVVGMLANPRQGTSSDIDICYRRMSTGF